ncbi:MAG: helix-turn-helix transcriptional regulator [Bacilli bacterium]|nr:helix-turn-helix transcriptional regulator [Bacilli bacterium]
MEYKTTDELLLEIAYRFKKIRKIRKVSQIDLSKRCNVSYASIKRFEETGEISLHSLLKMCVALEIDDVKELFVNIPYKDINEVIDDE